MYIEYLFSLYKPRFPFNRNGLVYPAAHTWDISQLLYSHTTTMSKYSNVNLEFVLDKFFISAL